MAAQIVIGTVCNTPKLAPAKWEQELDIRCCLTIEGKLLLVMVTNTHLFRLNAKCLQPVDTEILPVCEPLKIGVRLTEEL